MDMTVLQPSTYELIRSQSGRNGSSEAIQIKTSSDYKPPPLANPFFRSSSDLHKGKVAREEISKIGHRAKACRSC